LDADERRFSGLNNIAKDFMENIKQRFFAAIKKEVFGRFEIESLDRKSVV
jgi:hypothetical protein